MKTILWVIAIAVALQNSSPARASDLAEQAHSLRKVPADAAFYSASLRLKEQWGAFRDSRAYEKLMQNALIQLGTGQASMMWRDSNNPQVVQIREYLASPAGQDARAVLTEMLSDEIYAYGGSGIAEWIRQMIEANSRAGRARLEAKMQEAEGAGVEVESGDSWSTKAFVDELKKLENFSPGHSEIMLGFRVQDTARAKRELDEVHSLLRNLLDEQQPDLAARLQREQIDGQEFLTLRLDGTMISWDKIRDQSSNENFTDEQFNAVREVISKMTFVAALGVTEEFVVLSLGPTTDHLANAAASSKFSELPALIRLQKHAGEKVVSISYVSKTLAESFGSAQKTMDDITTGVEQALAESEVDEQDRKTLLDDIRSLNLAKYMPEPAETSAISFLTPRGYEGFQYTAGKRPTLDASEPLSVLAHVGRNPLLLIASRSKETAEDYNQLIAWLKRIAADGEKIVEKKADPEDWSKYQKIRDRGVELLRRLDTATREQLFPALAGGDGAFVLDITAMSKKWFKDMPESPKPLPMFEAALVTSVNDSEKLRQGVADYLDVVQDAVKLAREIDPEKIPQFVFPDANVTDISGGKMYKYSFPEEWGVDPQIAVNAALTDKYAVASLRPKTSERLLQGDKVDIDTSLPLDRPAALVTHVEFAKFIDAARPWIDYGLDVAMGRLKPEKTSEDESDDSDEEKTAAGPSNAALQLGFIVPQLQQFLDVATTLRSATTMTYEENGVWVTRSETHIEDLK